jgi:hypothetical protein
MPELRERHESELEGDGSGELADHHEGSPIRVPALEEGDLMGPPTWAGLVPVLGEGAVLKGCSRTIRLCALADLVVLLADRDPERGSFGHWLLGHLRKRYGVESPLELDYEQFAEVAADVEALLTT